MASLPKLVISLALAAVLGSILGQVYIRFGHSLSNRKLFARNFLVLVVTTTLIISIVRSSLALSLGLVGALSIVRFRAAIKEPEELAFLFLAISIGLGLGAGQAKSGAFFVGRFIVKGIAMLRRNFDRRAFLNACTRAGIASPLLPGILLTLAAQAQETGSGANPAAK